MVLGHHAGKTSLLDRPFLQNQQPNTTTFLPKQFSNVNVLLIMIKYDLVHTKEEEVRCTMSAYGSGIIINILYYQLS